MVKLLKSHMNLQFVTGVYAMLMSELMKKASKEVYGKDIKGKMLCIGNTFLTKCEVSTYEAIKRVLSLPLRHSSKDVLYVPTGLKTNRTRMLKSLAILEKMRPDDTNVFAFNVIDKYKNRTNNLYSMCLADFASTYISKKADNLPIEPDEIKSYAVPVYNINDDVKLNPNTIVVKNELGEIQKHSRLALFIFTKCLN